MSQVKSSDMRARAGGALLLIPALLLAVAGAAAGTEPVSVVERLAGLYVAGEVEAARRGFDEYLTRELASTLQLLGHPDLESYRRLAAIDRLGWLAEGVGVWYLAELGHRCGGGETPDEVRRTMAHHARSLDEALRAQEAWRTGPERPFPPAAARRVERARRLVDESLLRTTARSRPDECREGEQQALHTDVATWYRSGAVSRARRAAEERLHHHLELLRGAREPLAVEAGLRHVLELAFTILSFESRLPPAQRLGPDPELRDLLADSLAAVRDRRSELARPEVAQYVAERSGQAAAAWIRVLSGQVSRRRLQEVFDDFRAELRAAGIKPLGELVAESSVLADFLRVRSLETWVSGRPDPSSFKLPILRTDCDLTGDGVPEVFLTFSSTWSKNGFRWTVYDVAAGSSFRKLGEVVFHERYTRVLGPGRVRVLEPKQVGVFWWVEHLLVDGELVEQERHEVVEGVGSEGETLQLELETMRRFWEVQAIPRVVAELTTEGLGPWRDVTTGQVVTGLAPIVEEELRAPASPGASSRTEPRDGTR